jgi:aromatic-amino-acid transaminase
MFAYPTLTLHEVEELKRTHGVYLAPNGRLCIAALNDANFAQVVQALAQLGTQA